MQLTLFAEEERDRHSFIYRVKSFDKAYDGIKDWDEKELTDQQRMKRFFGRYLDEMVRDYERWFGSNRERAAAWLRDNKNGDHHFLNRNGWEVWEGEYGYRNQEETRSSRTDVFKHSAHRILSTGRHARDTDGLQEVDAMGVIIENKK